MIEVPAAALQAAAIVAEVDFVGTNDLAQDAMAGRWHFSLGGDSPGAARQALTFVAAYPVALRRWLRGRSRPSGTQTARPDRVQAGPRMAACHDRGAFAREPRRAVGEQGAARQITDQPVQQRCRQLTHRDPLRRVRSHRLPHVHPPAREVHVLDLRPQPVRHAGLAVPQRRPQRTVSQRDPLVGDEFLEPLPAHLLSFDRHAPSPNCRDRLIHFPPQGAELLTPRPVRAAGRRRSGVLRCAGC
ncbi:putative PEP-binding protein [Streptomyces sp. SA15]|uniref:putative PEP-binding protein n=1 Tax=Streptomyces sp. SA15 TaxID=934019 RepID=UPI001C52F4FD|nr:putative PEP-binding protein [Streptomyces sp. SA15]